MNKNKTRLQLPVVGIVAKMGEWTSLMFDNVTMKCQLTPNMKEKLANPENVDILANF